MIRESTFRISRRPYAADLSSLTVTNPDGPGQSFYAEVTAVWFRRRHGVTAACIGRLWDYQDSRPADVAMFLRNHTDGRYGGDCKGRWDGTRYWGAQEPGVMAAHLAVLRPMLVRFFELPAGYDGWWRFR